MKEKAKLRILLSAYACEPGKGSEPAVGWGLACQLAEEFEVWVFTRLNNCVSIESELKRAPKPSLHFVYYDLPPPFLMLKRLFRCTRLYYHFWQLASMSKVHALHRKIGFQACQHVTMVKYWAPSNLMCMPVPFIWGPVGGGENLPPALRTTLFLRSRIEAYLRNAGRAFGELDFMVRRTARAADIGIATTPATATRMARLKTRNIICQPQVALDEAEFCRLSETAVPSPGSPFRFVCIGRLVGWKGFHLAIQAFSQVIDSQAELWIIGAGPELKRLRRLAGSTPRISFKGRLHRDEVLTLLAETHVLIHPSMHDSGGFVCLEAMAAGRPVICLDTGGPAQLVGEHCGYRIPIGSANQTVDALADAMRCYLNDVELWETHSRQARQHVRIGHLWNNRCRNISRLIQELVIPIPGSHPPVNIHYNSV